MTSKYLTESQLHARISPELIAILTDDTTAHPNTIDETALDEAIAEAEATVESYLTGRYTTYLDAGQTHPLLRKWVTILTHTLLHQRRGQIPPDLSAERDNTIRELSAVFEGRMRLHGWTTANTPNVQPFTFPDPKAVFAPWEGNATNRDSTNVEDLLTNP